jgi:type I restriction enzyme S subunit
VPQDPNDGHISLLLESIHAERKAIPAKPKKKKLDGGRTVANLTTDSVRELLVRLHKDYFTFEELRGQVVADYETLKDIIFSLLNDKNPCIKQVFDEETHSMRFEWVKP